MQVSQKGLAYLRASEADVLPLLPSSDLAAGHFSIDKSQECCRLSRTSRPISLIPGPASGSESDSSVSATDPLLQHPLQ